MGNRPGVSVSWAAFRLPLRGQMQDEKILLVVQVNLNSSSFWCVSRVWALFLVVERVICSPPEVYEVWISACFGIGRPLAQAEIHGFLDLKMDPWHGPMAWRILHGRPWSTLKARLGHSRRPEFANLGISKTDPNSSSTLDEVMVFAEVISLVNKGLSMFFWRCFLFKQQ